LFAHKLTNIISPEKKIRRYYIKSQNNSYIHLFLALTKYAQQECKFFNTSKKLKSANASALQVKRTFFNAFSPLKFAIVSLYLVSILFFPKKINV